MHSKQNVKKTFLKIQASFLAFVIFMSMFSFGNAFGAEVLDSIDDYITTTLPDDFEDVKQEEIKLQYKGKDGTTKTLDLNNPVIDKEDFKNLNSLNLKYQFFVKNPQSGEISERAEFIKSGTEYILSTLPLSLDVKNANGNTDDFPIMSSSGSEIAKLKFVKHDDGTDIVIVFSDLVEDEGEGYDLNGFIELDMDINNNFIEEDGSDKIEIPMPGDAGNIIIDVEVPTEDDKKPTGIAKSSGGVNTETRTATWNITVSGPDDMDYFGGVLTDVIDTDIFESVKLYRGSGGNKSEIPANSYTYNESTGELSYEIPQGETSKTFTIETKVKDELFLSNEQITATNKVVLEQKDEDSPTYEFESDESKLSYTPQIISKNGTNYEGNKIKWTITGNKDKINLSDVVISDKFSNDVIFSSDEAISVSVGSKTYKIKADGETSTTEPYAVYENGELKVYFPGSIGENSIKVEFITEVEPKSESSDDFNYLNKATITGKHDGEGFGTIDSDTIGVGVADVDVQKSGSFTADGKKNAYIDWTAVLVSNKETYTKTVFVDKLPKYLSYDKDSIVVKKSGVVIDSNNYQLEFSGASFENEQMTITFNDENFIAKQTTITYKTNIDKEYYTSKEYLQSSNAWGNTHKFTNTAEVTIYDEDEPKADDSTTSTVDANNKLLQKFNESSLKASEDQTKPRFAYKLEINNNKLELTNFVVSDDLDNIKTQYATKNPNGDWYDGYNQIDLKWTYVKDSIKVVNSNWQVVSSEDYALDYDEENNELKISFAELNDKYIVTFEVEADVSEVEQFNKNGKFKVGGNKVNSVFDFDSKEREFETSSTDSGEKENKVLGKNVDTSKKSSSQMEYSLQINQYGVELPVTTIVDLLPKGLSVDTDTLKLYKNVIGSDGKWVTGEETDFDYEYSLDKDTGRNKLVITLPENNEPYVIKFTVDVDPEELEGNQISNSVYFDGDEADYSNTSSATAWIDSNSFGSNSSRTTLNVNKLSQVGNVGLANARFSIYRVASGEGDDAILEYVKSKVSNYEGKIKFTGLKRNNTYVLIEEEAPAEHKITDEDGITIVITDEPTIEKTIENAKIKKAQWQLSAKKKVSGLEAPNDVFDFVVEDKDGKVIFNGKNNSSYNSQGESDIAFTLADDVEKDDVFGDGKVKYENGNLVFTDDHYFEDEEPIDVGEYNLYLRELVDEDKDYYAYDEKVYEIKISVVNEKNSGDLTVKVTSEIQGSEPNDGADGGIIFTNKYSSKGTLQLEDGDKIVKGHDFKTGEKAEFNFNVYYGNEIIATGKSSDFVKDSANNQYSSAIEFTEIDLNELGGKGEYELSVFEDSTDSLAGFEYDESEYRISFTVDDDNKGKLFVKDFKITKNSSEVEDIEFVNEYVLEDIEKELSGKKTLNNTELKAGDFTFIRELVKLVDGKYEVVDSQYNEEVTNSVNGEFKFSNIRFTQEQAGSSFTFRITEKNDEKPGYEYDNSVYYITYNVVDNFVKGVLEVTESIVKADINGNIISDGVSEIAFTNEYNASGSIVISASKSFFNSRTKDVLDKISEREFKAEEFEFKLELYENDELVKTITAKNDADGIIVFDAIEFDIHDLANKYTVKISEIADSSKKGVVFSDIAYNGELSITDKGNGELDVKVVFEEEKLEFVNYYYAEPRNIAFIADKILDGGANKLKAEQFEFSLVNKANNEIIETVKNDADGKINFTEIEYTFEDIGTYNYVISEVIPSDVDKLSGYTYDETTYEIEVVVADNGDGTLSVVANVITDDGKVAIDEDSLSFVNTYRADTSITFGGNKKLDGRELEDGQFTFVLKDSEGNVVSEVKNGEDGSFEFDEITFTQADIGKTFVYTISEVNDETDNYIFDGIVYTARVVVEDNGDGTLKITAAIVNDAGEDVAEIQFVNQYEEPVDPNYPNLGDGDSKNPDSGVSEAAPFAALMMTSALVVLVSRKKDKKL